MLALHVRQEPPERVQDLLCWKALPTLVRQPVQQVLDQVAPTCMRPRQVRHQIPVSQWCREHLEQSRGHTRGCLPKGHEPEGAGHPYEIHRRHRQPSRWIWRGNLRTLALAFRIHCDGGGGIQLGSSRVGWRHRLTRLIPGSLGGHIRGEGSVSDRALRHRERAHVVAVRHANVVRSCNGGSTTLDVPGPLDQLGILVVQAEINLGTRTKLPTSGGRRTVRTVSSGRRRSISDPRSPSPLSRGIPRHKTNHHRPGNTITWVWRSRLTSAPIPAHRLGGLHPFGLQFRQFMPFGVAASGSRPGGVPEGRATQLLSHTWFPSPKNHVTAALGRKK